MRLEGRPLHAQADTIARSRVRIGVLGLISFATICRTLDGAGMAVYQAVGAFRMLTGLQADAERMRKAFVDCQPD